jgi:hypothetical protein
MTKKIPVLTKTQFATKYRISRMRIDRKIKRGAPTAKILKAVDGIPDIPEVVKTYLNE